MFPIRHISVYPSAYSTPLHRRSPYEHLPNYADVIVEEARRIEEAHELALLEALRLEEHGLSPRFDSYYGPTLHQPVQVVNSLYHPASVRYHQLASQQREAEARLRAAQIAREREQALLLERERIRKAEERARLARIAEEQRLIEEAELELRARLQFKERLRRAQEQARLTQWRYAQDAEVSRAHAERLRQMVAVMKPHMDATPSRPTAPIALSHIKADPAPARKVRFHVPSSKPVNATRFPFHAATRAATEAIPEKNQPVPQESLDPLLKLFFGEDFLNRQEAPRPAPTPEPEHPSDEELERQFLSLLKFFAGEEQPSEPVAGPSSAPAEGADRIPFSAKGKWRAGGAAAARYPSPADAEVAAQIAADAALAARLQAEEDARVARARAARAPSPGIVINEPKPSPRSASPAASASAPSPGIVINEPKSSPRPATRAAASAPRPASPAASSGGSPTVAKVASPTPIPVPTRAAAPAAEEPSPDNSSALSAIDALDAQFRGLETGFVFPAHVDTRAASPAPSISSASSASTLSLPHTRANAPVHAHAHALERLLGRLDAVESNGDAAVRARRKELVGRVEAALARVEQTVEDVVAAADVDAAPVAEESTAEHHAVTHEVATAEEPEPKSDISLFTVAQDAFGAEPAAATSAPEAAAEETPAIDEDAPAPVEVPAPVEPSATVEAPTVLQETIIVDEPALSVEENIVASEDTTDAALDLSASEVTVKAASGVVSPVPVVSEAAPATDNIDSAVVPTPEVVTPAPEIVTLAPVVHNDDNASELDTFLLPATRPISPRRVPAHSDSDSEDDALLVNAEINSSDEAWSDVEGQ